MTLDCSGGGEDLVNQSTRSRGLDQVGTFGQEAPSLTPPGVAL